MAFTTEFVMGAGGAEVEEIPVSMSGTGDGTVYPLATVDAGDGSLIAVAGTMTPSTTLAASRPHMQMGGFTHQAPHAVLEGEPQGGMIGGIFTGSVPISVLSRDSSTSRSSSFTGTVYVARM